MNATYINPFLIASKSVMKDLCQIDLEIGKPYLSKADFKGEEVLVILGITGQLVGQVILSMTIDTACDIASHMMMGMPVTELDSMSASAISELSNMILGNVATIFSTMDKVIDITPPSICIGKDMSISVSNTNTICVPFHYDNDRFTFGINIAISDKS